MAETNSTSTSTDSDFKHKGKSFPISTLTKNKHVISLAANLHQQAMQMDKAQMNGTHFQYQQINIPPIFRHIFGK
ncbi:MAG: hypothetical protein Q8K61_10610 [Gallionella sp.]|nr:hypothetical protein [Gallionella sp.]